MKNIKQTLKVGDRVILTQTNNRKKNANWSNLKKGDSFVIKEITNDDYFRPVKNKSTGVHKSILQLITPKKSQWKYSRNLITREVSYLERKGEISKFVADKIRYFLAKQSTPKNKSKEKDNQLNKQYIGAGGATWIKQEKKSKEIKEIKPIKNQDSAGYLVDVHNQLITIKLNQVIDTINLLIKDKNANKN